MEPATSVPTRPTTTEILVPWITRLRMSRPWKSVPSTADQSPVCHAGSVLIRAPGNGLSGSWGAIQGAKIATSTNRATMITAAAGASRR